MTLYLVAVPPDSQAVTNGRSLRQGKAKLVGASPYGCLDMAGNVWEWTRSLFKDYKYQPEDGREDLNAGPDARSVLRGGSFSGDAGVARGAFRFRRYPYYGFRFDGFRVVVSPFAQHDSGL